jgi:hypothetical protein
MNDMEKTHKEAIENFAKQRKLSQLQNLCCRASLSQAGARDELIARIVDAAKISAIDFNTVPLEDLTFAQLLGKCITQTTNRRAPCAAHERHCGTPLAEEEGQHHQP